MQDKHVVIVRATEDRDIFINKVKYPKTVYQIEGKGTPEDSDIVIDHTIGFPAIMSSWILNNWDNLPEYIIFCQANPNDHVESMLLAIDVDFTSDWGSFSYARALHNQYSTDWIYCCGPRLFLKEFGIQFDNDNNISKGTYVFYPGDHFYISRKKILEKSKSFFEKLIYFDNEEVYFNLLRNHKYPTHFWLDLNLYHTELKKLNKNEKLDFFIGPRDGRDYGHFGLTTEILFPYFFADEKKLKLLNKSQAVIGNELYFDTSKNQYDHYFNFEIFPYSNEFMKTINNFRLFENDWFDYNSEAYMKWREKLIEKTYIEAKRMNFDADILLDFYERIGYKHISL